MLQIERDTWNANLQCTFRVCSRQYRHSLIITENNRLSIKWCDYVFMVTFFIKVYGVEMYQNVIWDLEWNLWFERWGTVGNYVLGHCYHKINVPEFDIFSNDLSPYKLHDLKLKCEMTRMALRIHSRI